MGQAQRGFERSPVQPKEEVTSRPPSGSGRVGPCATGILIDQTSWDATLQGDYEGHALVIDDGGHRCPASAPFGDAASFGTPGAPNAACP